jgi:ABC-type glycerol-3-phosphate transport system substrate-binding protein
MKPRYSPQSTSLKVMGFPMMRSTPVLYYNKDVLDAAGVTPPTNWDELIATAKDFDRIHHQGTWLA